MRRVGLLLLGLGLAWAVPGQAGTPPATPADGHYQAGLTLQGQAEMAHTKPDAERLYRQAIAEYQADLQARPDHCESRLYGALCLTQLAELATDEAERIHRLREADQRFAAAADCPGVDPSVFEQWAIVLRTHLFNLLTDPAERLAVLQRVIKVCERGLARTTVPTPRAQLQRHLGSASMWSAEFVEDPAEKRRLLERAVQSLRDADKVVGAQQHLYQDNDLGIALMSLGHLTGDRTRLQEAATELATALKFYPDQYDTQYNLATIYCLLGQIGLAAEHLAIAIDHDPDGEYQRRAETDPHLVPMRGSPAYTAALDRRRRRLAEDQAQESFRQALQAQQTAERVRDPAIAIPLFRRAVELYQQTITLTPDHCRAQALCATALAQLFQLSAQDSDQQTAYLDLARQRFAAAAQCPGVEPQIYDQWATFLLKSYYPRLRQPAEQQRPLREACQVLEQGVQHARFSGLRGHLEAQWATALVMLAQNPGTPPTNSLPLYAASLKHFQTAVAAQTISRSATFHELWGIALLRVGSATRDTMLVRQATERFLKSLELSPGNLTVHYNLACAYALIDQPDQALRHLGESLQHDQQESLRTTALQDPDLESLHDLDGWRRLFQPRRRVIINEQPTVSGK